MSARVLLFLAASAGMTAQSVYIVQDTPGPAKALAQKLDAAGYKTSVEDQPTFASHMHSLGPPKAIFMYVHNTFDPKIEDFLISYAENGGRLIVVHHGMASAKMKNQKWPGFLGVRILPKDAPVNAWAVAMGRFDLVNLAPGHWVTTHNVTWPKTVAYTPSDSPSVEQQLPAISFETEIYYNLLFTDGRRKTVLFGMRAEADGKVAMQDRGGWMMPAGRGWVFYLQPGHYARDLQDPNFFQIIVNTIEWTPGR